MSNIQSDDTDETGTGGPDIHIDTEVLEAFSPYVESAGTEPKISRWLDCWRR